MGGVESRISDNYSLFVPNTGTDDETPIVRPSTHPDGLIDNFVEPVNSLWDSFEASVRKYPDRPCVGRRFVGSDGKRGAYVWQSYAQVHEIAEALARYLWKTIVPERFAEESYSGAQNIRLVGLLGKNTAPWLISELAAYRANAAIVPFYSALADVQVVYIIKQARLKYLVASVEAWLALRSAFELDSAAVPLVVLLTDIGEVGTSQRREAENLASKYGVELVDWFDAVELGKSHQVYQHIEVPQPTPKCLGAICYTSGTSGEAKGVMLTQRSLVAMISGVLRGPMADPTLKITSEEAHLSYLPLAHVLERTICGLAYAKGARVGVFSGDMETLLDDVMTLRPTVFIGVPRVYYKLHDKIMARVNGLSVARRTLFYSALQYKVESFRSTGSVVNAFWDKFVFKTARIRFGGRLRYMLVAGAAMDSSVQERLQVLFSAPLVVGYGLTEVSGASHASLPEDPVLGTVGGSIPTVEWKLQSTSEMGYLVTDEYPRGEVLLRGPIVFEGYFCRPDLTQSVLDADGWFHTGDIGMLLPNGALKIIDRKKNIFKLAQGEYIAAEYLENLYTRANLVGQICVAGVSSEACLVAVVVPDEDALIAWTAARAAEGTETVKEDVKGDERLKRAIMQQLSEVAAETHVRGFERIRGVVLAKEPFTPENRLLTPTMKLIRHAVYAEYQKEIAACYAAMKKSASV